MALHLFKLTLLTVLLFAVQIKVFAQLPACKDSFPASLLPNNSFEQHSDCITDYGGSYEGGVLGNTNIYYVPGWNAAYRNREVIYHNVNCRLPTTKSIFDSSIYCYSPVKVPMPLPDGDGFVEIVENASLAPLDEINSVKTYIATCPPQPLYAGLTYTFSFYVGFGKFNPAICGLPPFPPNSVSPYGFALYGRADCPHYPIDNTSDTSGCLTHFPGWIMLGYVTLSGNNQWVQGVIEFTPPVNINSIAVGADCSNNLNAITSNELHYYLDKFVLATKADFAFRTITAVSGNACTGNYVLKAPAYGGAAYQWYKDGVAIPGATAQTYTVPGKDAAAGNYIANISLPWDSCLNTLPYTVRFTDLNKFRLGNDTTLCAPVTKTLNASWRSATAYLWNDRSTGSTGSINQSGTYRVELTDANGCTTTDSITVNIKGCDKCAVFVPSAFTPDNDGLNDVFRAKPQCANIALINFRMCIYNRWGLMVFESSDINKDWDGKYKGTILDASTYIYVINYAYNQQQTFQKTGTLILLR